jgi:5'-nucleotidase
VYPFNEFGVDVSCLGNHDFDYSLEELVDLMAQTKGPWLLSNVHNPQT